MKSTRYLALLELFPPRVIHDEQQLAATEAVVDGLLARKDELDADEDAYLDLLSALIHRWEEDNVAMPELSGVDLLRVLLADRGLTQRDLVRVRVFATDSVASEVMAGKRRMTVEHIARLARYFHLPADLFLPEAHSTPVPA